MGGWEGVSGPKLVWVSWVGDFLCSNGVGFLGSHLYFSFLPFREGKRVSVCLLLSD